MGEFFANLDRYAAGGKGGGDRGAYLRLWDGGRFTMDRVGRGAFAILNWSACFFGGIQPGPIQQIAKASADDGMLHRLLFVVPGSQGVGKDRVPDQVSIERYEAIIRALAAFHPAIAPGKEYPDHVVFHRDAHQHREEIDTLARALAAMPDTSRRLVSALGKIPGQFARLCLTFHMINIVDGKLSGTITPSLEVVPEETAMRVAALLHDVLIPHLLRAHAVMFSTAQTTHAQWIAGYILACKMDRITSRDVTRAYRALRPPECKNELADVMASLVTVGWLEPIVPRNLAKPVWSWDVNPNAHTLFADRAEQERRAREQAKADIAENVAVFRRSYRRTQA